MQRFEITRYVKKLLPFIIIVCVALTFAVHSFLNSRQTYYAQAVIKYEGDNPQVGLTPSGETLDVNQIKSSAVMTKVIENLRLDEIPYSVDDLISRTKIWEIVDADEQARKDALLEEGEEYENKPIKYIVSFYAYKDEGPGFARSVLDEILDVYFVNYSEQYVNQGSTTNALKNIYNENYDYIEIMEIISDQLKGTQETLSARINSNPTFRSAATGKSFLDFYNEIYYLSRVKLSKINAQILEYQITKNKDLLISNYTERIRQNDLTESKDIKKIDDVLMLIEAYVNKMQESGNTDITYEYILDDVYDGYVLDETGAVIQKADQTVTYDDLIYNWRDYSREQKESIIDTAYSRYIMDTFSRCMEYGVTACSGDANHTCAAVSMPEYSDIVNKIETEIKDLVDRLNVLYNEIDVSNNEFNEYLGARNISTLSSASVKESMNVKLYTFIAALFLLVVCCCGAIVLGRLADIVQYAFYTDHMVKFNNRMAFDSYLKKNDKKLLGDGTLCIVLNLKNHNSINKSAGRDITDKIIVLIADIIRDVFNKMDTFNVYNGNGQYIIIVEKSDYVAVEYIMNRFKVLLDNREIYREGPIVYELGISESSRDHARSVRGLLTKAVQSKVEYVSDYTEEDL